MLGYLQTLPAFLTWFPIAAAMVAAFAAAYSAVTPWREMRLIRDGNAAAAISFGGAILGYSAVVATVMLSASSRGDLVVWGAVGFAVQLAAFAAARLVFGPGLREKMEQGCAGAGLFLASVSVAAGIINASTMAY